MFRFEWDRVFPFEAHRAPFQDDLGRPLHVELRSLANALVDGRHVLPIVGERDLREPSRALRDRRPDLGRK